MNPGRTENPFIRLCERLIAPLGRFLGGLLPWRNQSGQFFFFPFCHTGGAEKVHSQIVSCFADQRPWVFFTKWSPQPDVLLGEFEKSASVFNWRRLLKYTYPLSAGMMAGFINKHPNAVVFGCNTLFYYRMLPWLAPHVRKIDLLHAFGGGAEAFSLPVAGLLDKRVVINRQTIADLTGQYQQHGLDPQLADRIQLIPNAVPVPAAYRSKPFDGKLNIIFVGRNSAEKRIHLIGRIASACAVQKLPVRLLLVGDVESALAPADRPHCRLAGQISDQEELAGLYAEAHLLLLTSSREGFPLTIMEAMSHGAVPIATAVGGIPEHISHGENGFLLDQPENEDAVVEQAVNIISYLCTDHEKVEQLSRTAFAYATANFSELNFRQAYRMLLGREETEHA